MCVWGGVCVCVLGLLQDSDRVCVSVCVGLASGQ